MILQWVEIYPSTNTQKQLSEIFTMEIVLGSSDTQALETRSFEVRSKEEKDKILDSS